MNVNDSLNFEIRNKRGFFRGCSDPDDIDVTFSSVFEIFNWPVFEKVSAALRDKGIFRAFDALESRSCKNNRGRDYPNGGSGLANSLMFETETLYKDLRFYNLCNYRPRSREKYLMKLVFDLTFSISF